MEDGLCGRPTNPFSAALHSLSLILSRLSPEREVLTVLLGSGKVRAFIIIKQNKFL